MKLNKRLSVVEKNVGNRVDAGRDERCREMAHWFRRFRGWNPDTIDIVDEITCAFYPLAFPLPSGAKPRAWIEIQVDYERLADAYSKATGDWPCEKVKWAGRG